ncbi:SulP family inorganic anion transporter [Catalinimonas niigatensis]|uniref:SulP family inorganic anion transporter n=1 Tax=Catalinimonas niigatensis TaxID=1397264 RepID=UPI0026653CA1|nr:SulP family inorganic anion transporter [Catalinimonas niigatensis]WPP51020.1 SulP family inorganic anion transporter [Catalinimonas niigatensis]
MSSSKNNFHPLKNLNKDIPASIVVFLVAMPLCLGIALASGAPLFSGLIAGIVGGIVVGALSGSPLGVSGPAAGLAVIVLTAIQDLGSFEVFLVAVILAGVIQIIMGFARGGIIAYYFPSSVIIGMLAGIGIVIAVKQIPHAFGYDRDYEGDVSFLQPDGENTFSELVNMLDFISPGALIITAIALAILLLWERDFMKNKRIFQLIPGPLVAVIAGIFLNIVFSSMPQFALRADQLVNVPLADSIDSFFGNFTFPDFAALANLQIYITAIVIAVVASLETLLCVEAADKLDPYKRVTPTNRELKAQGIGNIVSGLIGGLPITQVIVRSSTNVQSGGKTKASAIIHGFLLIATVVLIPTILNLIPLATLAAILFVVGYKLAKPSLFKKMYREGKGQFIPFIATIIGIVFTDLLIGLGIGLVISIIFILYNNFQIPYLMRDEDMKDKKKIKIVLSQEVTFLNKASILQTLNRIPDNSEVEIDATNTFYMHQDVLEIIEDFKVNARERNIHLTLTNLYLHKDVNPPFHMLISFDGDGNGHEKESEVEVIDPKKV